MIRLALVGTTLIVTPATSASIAKQMAVRSGQVIGAAAGCGVSHERLVAVGRTTIELIRDVRKHRATRTGRVACMSGRFGGVADLLRFYQDQYSTTFADFERAEQNQLSR